MGSMRISGLCCAAVFLLWTVDGRGGTVIDCDGEDCRDALYRLTDAQCPHLNVDDTLTFDAHAPRYTSGGMQALLAGLSDISGSPSPFEKHLEREYLDIPQYLVDVVRSLYFVYFLITLASIWTVVALAFLCAMCCPSCRRGYGECSRGKCCGDRLDRCAPIQEVKKSKVRWFQYCGVIFGGVFVLIGCTFGIGFTAVLGQDIEDLECVPFATSYELINGTLRYEKPWKGAAYIEDVIDESAGFFEPVGPSVDCDTSQSWACDVRLHTNYLETNASEPGVHVDKLALSGSLTKAEFDKSSDWGGTNVPVNHYCLYCAVIAENDDIHEPLEEAVKDIVDDVNEQTGPDSTLGDMEDTFEDAKESWRDTLQLLGDMMESVTEMEETFSNWIVRIFWIFPVLLFCFGLIGGIYGVVVMGLLWKHYKKGTEPESESMRNHFGCLWIWFAFYGAQICAMSGVALGVAQVASDPCTFVGYSVLQDADFAKYSSLEKFNTTAVYACALDDSDGDLLEAFEIKDEYDKFLTAIDGLETRMDFDAVEEVRKTMADSSFSVLDEAAEMYLMDAIDSSSSPLEGVITYSQAICGSLQDANYPTASTTLLPLLQGHVTAINSAIDAIVTGAGNDIDAGTANAEKPADNCNPLQGLDALETRLNGEIPSSCTPACTPSTVCIGSGTGCYVINDSVYHPSTNVGDADPSLQDEIRCFYDCILTGTPTATTRTKAVQFANAVHWAAQRIRMRNTPGLYKNDQGDDLAWDSVGDYVKVETDGFDDGVTGLENVITGIEAATLAELEVARKYWETDVQGSYNCKVVNTLVREVVSLACYDVTGTLMVSSTCGFIFSIGYFVSYILSWKQWHYWRDRLAASRNNNNDNNNDDYKRQHVKDDDDDDDDLKPPPYTMQDDDGLVESSGDGVSVVSYRGDGIIL